MEASNLFAGKTNTRDVATLEIFIPNAAQPITAEIHRLAGNTELHKQRDQIASQIKHIGEYRFRVKVGKFTYAFNGRSERRAMTNETLRTVIGACSTVSGQELDALLMYLCINRTS